mmetsp:Transcript_78323/g.221481  ORF Transcript_78323/g.221481 Transcript_78323/m.221481 type:complete len:231 (-) Transcript_78323:145-837(-)
MRHQVKGWPCSAHLDVRWQWQPLEVSIAACCPLPPSRDSVRWTSSARTWGRNASASMSYIRRSAALAGPTRPSRRARARLASAESRRRSARSAKGCPGPGSKPILRWSASRSTYSLRRAVLKPPALGTAPPAAAATSAARWCISPAVTSCSSSARCAREADVSASTLFISLMVCLAVLSAWFTCSSSGCPDLSSASSAWSSCPSGSMSSAGALPASSNDSGRRAARLHRK